jgi:hypothetical protein
MSLANYPLLTFTMGFKVGNTDLPDPSAFSGKESDLDTMGERDATGFLHRNKVATKHPLSMSYNNIPWGAIREICALLTNASFQFTFPNPFSAGGTQTITADVGDRDFEAVWSPEDGDWIGNLKFSGIEY